MKRIIECVDALDEDWITDVPSPVWTIIAEFAADMTHTGMLS